MAAMGWVVKAAATVAVAEGCVVKPTFDPVIAVPATALSISTFPVVVLAELEFVCIV